MASDKQKQHPSPTPRHTSPGSHLTLILPLALLLGMLGLVGSLLVRQEGEMLFRAQELNLWIPGDTFYQTFSLYPGGWLSWAGSYLTDFFFHPALGVTLLMAAWALLMAMLSWLYRLRGWQLLLTSLVPLMLLAAFTQTGYWLFYQKLHGHLWVPTLGISLSVLAALVCHKVCGLLSPLWGTLLRSLWLVPLAWYGYQVMGAWSFAAVLLTALPTGPASVSGQRPWLRSLLLCLPVVLAAALLWYVPRLAYDTVYEQTLFDEIYRAGMPCFRNGDADLCVYRRAYYLLALSFLPLLVMGWIPQSLRSRKAWRCTAPLLLVLLLCGAAAFIHDRWNRDQNLHIEVAMSNAIDRNDWQGALHALTEGTVTDSIAPTRAIVMMKNLALYRLGRAGDDMFNYPEGSRLQNVDEYYRYGDLMYPDSIFHHTDPKDLEHAKLRHRWNIRLSQIAGKKMYYHYGKLNFCYRWCMEDAVEFGWRVDELKMMAQCAMLKEENTVARKYLNLLKQTRYHRAWAEEQEKFVGNFDAMRQDPVLRPITYLMQVGDRLDGDNTLIELYLLQTFANGNGVDPYYQEMTLISAMLMKDIDLFWPRFMGYATMHKDEKDFHMPRHYQEAAYLYGHLENKVDISQMPFDPSVKQTYERFMAFNSQPHIAPLSEEKKAEVFKPQFGHTFYYFYFLRRNQKTN